MNEPKPIKPAGLIPKSPADAMRAHVAEPLDHPENFADCTTYPCVDLTHTERYEFVSPLAAAVRDFWSDEPLAFEYARALRASHEHHVETHRYPAIGSDRVPFAGCKLQPCTRFSTGDRVGYLNARALPAEERTGKPGFPAGLDTEPTDPISAEDRNSLNLLIQHRQHHAGNGIFAICEVAPCRSVHAGERQRWDTMMERFDTDDPSYPVPCEHLPVGGAGDDAVARFVATMDKVARDIGDRLHAAISKALAAPVPAPVPLPVARVVDALHALEAHLDGKHINPFALCGYDPCAGLDQADRERAVIDTRADRGYHPAEIRRNIAAITEALNGNAGALTDVVRRVLRVEEASTRNARNLDHTDETVEDLVDQVAKVKRRIFETDAAGGAFLAYPAIGPFESVDALGEAVYDRLRISETYAQSADEDDWWRAEQATNVAGVLATMYAAQRAAEAGIDYAEDERLIPVDRKIRLGWLDSTGGITNTPGRFEVFTSEGRSGDFEADGFATPDPGAGRYGPLVAMQTHIGPSGRATVPISTKSALPTMHPDRVPLVDLDALRADTERRAAGHAAEDGPRHGMRSFDDLTGGTITVEGGDQPAHGYSLRESITSPEFPVPAELADKLERLPVIADTNDFEAGDPADEATFDDFEHGDEVTFTDGTTIGSDEIDEHTDLSGGDEDGE